VPIQPSNSSRAIPLQLIANTIRGLSMDAVQKAKSGHPGMPMGMADVMSVLWGKFLRFSPNNPNWLNRDRFILSGGHGSMLHYSLLHLFGYDMTLEDIKSFRQWGSRTPGHPEYRHTPGIETTTGPLGQGLGNAIGMAIAERHLSARFNKPGLSIIDHHTYVEVGDGDLEEGISHEVCSLAGHLKLNKLIVLYDSNHITIDGDTTLSYTEDVKSRFLAYHWEVILADGHDYAQIESALRKAQNSKDKPVLIIFKTIIGYGSPNRAGTSKAHGEPLGEEEVRLSKQKLGIPEIPFYVPDELDDLAQQFHTLGKELEEAWQKSLTKYKERYPQLYNTLIACTSKANSPSGIFKNFEPFTSGKPLATRAASGRVLDQIAAEYPCLIGGSADLTPSNKTLVSNMGILSADNPSGQYIYYGVREFGMGAIMNGLRLHSGLQPYGGTFFVFSDYMRATIRMAALMKLRIVYVLTHDSIGLGEDGPTHQPIEHLSSLRAMPGIKVIRPMDGAETLHAWRVALTGKEEPTCLVLTRQGLPAIERDTTMGQANDLEKGGYILATDEAPEIIILSSGSEVHIALEAKQALNELNLSVRVISMPCMELFDRQDEAYRESVLPRHITKRIAIEAAAPMSWYKYTGLEGKVIGLKDFGASAPFETLYSHFGITKEALIDAALSMNKKQ